MLSRLSSPSIATPVTPHDGQEQALRGFPLGRLNRDDRGTVCRFSLGAYRGRCIQHGGTFLLEQQYHEFGRLGPAGVPANDVE